MSPKLPLCNLILILPHPLSIRTVIVLIIMVMVVVVVVVESVAKAMVVVAMEAIQNLLVNYATSMLMMSFTGITILIRIPFHHHHLINKLHLFLTKIHGNTIKKIRMYKPNAYVVTPYFQPSLLKIMEYILSFILLITLLNLKNLKTHTSHQNGQLHKKINKNLTYVSPCWLMPSFLMYYDHNFTTIVHLIIQLPTNALSTCILSFVALYKSQLDYKSLRIFNCVYFHILRPYNGHKL
ncbi:hypothetical protein CR513_07353, partial [Mucuna pruriens]